MASRSINKVVLIGNLTRDPELKYTPSGTAVCTFGVATNRSWATATGETKEDVQFHRIVAWQKLAELCSKILTKGRKVYLEGRLTYRSYIAKDGTQKSITEIVLDDFVVFDDRRKSVEAEDSAPSEERTEEIAPVSSKESSVKKKKDKIESEEKKDTSDMDEKVDPEDIPF